MAIRPATSADLEAIVALWLEQWEAQYTADPRVGKSPMAEMVMRRMFDEQLANERSRILVSEENGRVEGYAFGTIQENPPAVLDQCFGFVSDLAVTRESRRRGVGMRLVAMLEDWFRSKGLPYAIVNVVSRNADAGAFWGRAGYDDFVRKLRKTL